MPTNQYVNSFNNGITSEQSLYEDLIIESIKMYGFDVNYLPRDVVEIDEILNEEKLSRFNEVYTVEMYLSELDGFEGEDFLGKFGLHVADQCTLVVSVKRWNELVKSSMNDITQERPYEGDLIWVPFAKAMFEIRFVEDQAPFFKLNHVPTYSLRCEIFTYESQDIDTGIDDIDDIERKYDAVLAAAVAVTNGEFIPTEKLTMTNSQGDVITAELVAVDESGLETLFSLTNISYPAGTLVRLSAGTGVSGDESGANAIINEIIDLADARFPNIDNDAVDKADIYEKEKDVILDFTENNPFGGL